jgi:mono/diheme cytochrome c family protein
MQVDPDAVEDLCAFPSEPETRGSDLATTALAVRRTGTVVAFQPDTGELVIGGGRIRVAPELEHDRGHQLFHQVTMVGLSCASCHPEGGEDGHTWDFQPVGPRRTQSLLGGLGGHEPFHWNGDQADMNDIMRVTFGERMQGFFDPADVNLIQLWLDAQPTPAGVVHDAAMVERGRLVFEDAGVGCAGCHSGEALTNDRNEDVGTGRDFQVPSLRGVMHRAPYFHDGCAATLDAVVGGACGTSGRHGNTAGLTPAQRADLVAYLRSL